MVDETPDTDKSCVQASYVLSDDDKVSDILVADSVNNMITPEICHDADILTTQNVVYADLIDDDSSVDIDDITKKLIYISGEIEDIELQEEIKTIADVINFIYLHYNGSNYQDYINIVENFSNHLYEQLVRYDKVENMRFNTFEAEELMREINNFTKVIGKTFNNILQTLSNQEFFKYKRDVKGLIAELKIRGLVD